MALTDISVTFNDVLKSPLTYALIVLSIILTIFVNSFIGAKDESSQNCEKEKTDLRIQLSEANKTIKEERADKDAILKAFLVQKGVISNLKSITDTLNQSNK